MTTAQTEVKSRGLYPPYNARPHQPRHPLQDGLYHVLSGYRASKRVSRKRSAEFRREALGIIAAIKGAAQ